MIRNLLVLTAFIAATGGAIAQVGQPLPDLPYRDFTGTEAQSIQDFGGRVLLIEVFAYW